MTTQTSSPTTLVELVPSQDVLAIITNQVVTKAPKEEVEALVEAGDHAGLIAVAAGEALADFEADLDKLAEGDSLKDASDAIKDLDGAFTILFWLLARTEGEPHVKATRVVLEKLLAFNGMAVHEGSYSISHADADVKAAQAAASAGEVDAEKQRRSRACLFILCSLFNCLSTSDALRYDVLVSAIRLAAATSNVDVVDAFMSYKVIAQTAARLGDVELATAGIRSLSLLAAYALLSSTGDKGTDADLGDGGSAARLRGQAMLIRYLTTFGEKEVSSLSGESAAALARHARTVVMNVLEHPLRYIQGSVQAHGSEMDAVMAEGGSGAGR